MTRGGNPGETPKRLVSAQELFSQALAGKGYDPRVFAVFELWDRLAGADASRARAVGVRKGRLYVDVDSPVRAHGLTLRKRELLKKLNAPFGGAPPLSDIIFRPGEASLPTKKHGPNAF